MHNDRLFVPINKAVKAKCEKHVAGVHGVTLAAWVRQLMKRDLEQHFPSQP